MKIFDLRKPVGAFVAGAALLSSASAMAQEISGDVIKIGVMSDQSGPYADNVGPGAVEAARMAIEDFGGEINGKKIELVIADDQNKPDIGAAIAQKWIDQEGVDAIVGGSASSIAIAIQKMMAEKKKPYMLSGSTSSSLTNDACTPYSSQWAIDTYAMAKSGAKLLAEAGKDTVYFITVDYTFGKQWQADATKFIEADGGKIVGSVTYPLNTNDFSSYLLQAQASGAKAIVLVNGGTDFSNALKQSVEFGIQAGGQDVASLGRQFNEIQSVGLALTKGMKFATPFYWDLNDETRAFTERFKKRFRDRIPNEAKAGTYSAVNHYLKSVKEAGTDDGEAVNAKMHELPINDFAMKDVKMRADGQVMRPWYAVTVKSPEESKYPDDFYLIGAELAAEDVWRSPEDSVCPLLKQ